MFMFFAFFSCLMAVNGLSCWTCDTAQGQPCNIGTDPGVQYTCTSSGANYCATEFDTYNAVFKRGCINTTMILLGSPACTGGLSDTSLCLCNSDYCNDNTLQNPQNWWWTN